MENSDAFSFLEIPAANATAKFTDMHEMQRGYQEVYIADFSADYSVVLADRGANHGIVSAQ